MMSGKRVLVIDDSLTTRRYLELVLGRAGNDIVTVSDGAEGVRQWRAQRFDLILLDLLLPDGDGLALLRQIREADQEVCVVIVTGHGGIRSAIEATRQGADGYVEKSNVTAISDPDELFHPLERAMQIRTNQAARARLERELVAKNAELEQARQALLNERNQLCQILFSLNEMVIVLDTAGHVILLNPLAQQALVAEPTEVLGQPLDAFGPFGDIAAKARQVSETGATQELTTTHLHGETPAGRPTFKATLSPVLASTGEPLGVVIVVRDVTQEVELERVKRDINSMVMHDLRSPAASLLMAAQMLTDAGTLNAAQQDTVDIILRNGRKLSGLINDFLDYAAIDSGYLRLAQAETDLRQVVAEAVADLRPLVEQKEQTLTLDLPEQMPLAFVDGRRIGQVVENLLSNAIKYTGTGGQIRVMLRADTQSFTLAVTDNGIGVAPDQIPLLFNKYHRIASDGTRRIKGTGLGLLIVKEIVAAHGGQVSVESTPGEGSTFRVTLPRASNVGLPPTPHSAG